MNKLQRLETGIGWSQLITVRFLSKQSDGNCIVYELDGENRPMQPYKVDQKDLTTLGPSPRKKRTYVDPMKLIFAGCKPTWQKDEAKQSTVASN